MMYGIYLYYSTLLAYKYIARTYRNRASTYVNLLLTIIYIPYLTITFILLTLLNQLFSNQEPYLFRQVMSTYQVLTRVIFI
jgi:hypothetical protein